MENQRPDWKALVRAMLAVIVVAPTMTVLCYLALNDSEWALGILGILLLGVLGFYGFKFKKKGE